jgi:hypothetical protein
VERERVPGERDRIVGGVERGVDPREPGHQIVAGAHHGPAQREAVGHAEQLVVVADGLLVERVDERPSVQLDRHPTLTLERDQRFSHRDAADPERGRDVILRHPLTRAQLAVEDHPADQRCRLVATAATRRPALVRQRWVGSLHDGLRARLATELFI